MRRAALVVALALCIGTAPAVARTTLSDVIVTGKAHIGLDSAAFSSRAEARAAVSERAAPFFSEIRSAALQTGSIVLQTWATAPAVRVLATPAMLERLAQMPAVVRVEHDAADAIKLADEPGGVEPENSGGRQMIQAEDIWALGYRGEGIKLAIIDTGIDPAHEAFRLADGGSRITGWVDWVNGQPAPYDDNGHGTHVAGTAAGSALYEDPTHGFFQQEGVAPRAQIMAAKFLTAGGSGTFANAINSLNWAFDNGADITNNSWGASCQSSVAVIQTVRMLTDLGMLSVFTAGGSGPGPGTVGGPACGESALSVGGVDQNGVVAGFSGRGPCSDPDLGTPARICPDLVAKAVTVTSAWPRPSAPNGLRTLSGTSMAAPFVAGGVALAEQMKREITGTGWDTSARAEETVFKETALDLGPAGPDNAYGWGLPQLLNIYELLGSEDIALIVPSLGISRAIIFEGQTTSLSFGVRNLGGAVATGRFLVTRTSPGGVVTVMRDVVASLGLLDRELFSEEFEADANTPPGTHVFRGSFDFTWTDPGGGVHTGFVERSGTFLVRRVVIHASLSGFEDSALPLVPQHVLFSVTNNGNDTASGTTIEVTVPADYLFLPNVVSFDPMNLRTMYSSPPPDEVTEGEDGVTLRYTVGTLDPGESFEFTSTLVPRSLGTFVVTALTAFTDGAGSALGRAAEFTQTVGAGFPI